MWLFLLVVSFDQGQTRKYQTVVVNGQYLEQHKAVLHSLAKG
jgi:hypothetical protein